MKLLVRQFESCHTLGKENGVVSDVGVSLALLLGVSVLDWGFNLQSSSVLHLPGGSAPASTPNQSL